MQFSDILNIAIRFLNLPQKSDLTNLNFIKIWWSVHINASNWNRLQTAHRELQMLSVLRILIAQIKNA